MDLVCCTALGIGRLSDGVKGRGCGTAHLVDEGGGHGSDPCWGRGRPGCSCVVSDHTIGTVPVVLAAAKQKDALQLLLQHRAAMRVGVALCVDYSCCCCRTRPS